MHTPKYTVLFIHLLISATLLLILSSIMLLWWYPKGLFGIAGGWDGLKILLPVDMVLGPTLTFLFYKPGKARAWLDLCSIAVVQMVALSYGAYAVYSQHPQALVLSEGQLIALTPTDFDEARSYLEDQGTPYSYPAALDQNLPPVVVAKPFTKENYGSYLESVLNGGLEHALRADLYQGLNTGASAMESAKLNAEEVKKQTGTTAAANLVYFRLHSTHGSGVAVFKAENQQLLEVLPVI